MIYTSYFGNIKRIVKENKNVEFFSIAGKSPDFYKNENRFELPILAPRYTWWKEWYDKFKDNPESKELVDFYKEKYNETVLKNLNPHSIVNTLYRISNGKDIIVPKTINRINYIIVKFFVKRDNILLFVEY